MSKLPESFGKEQKRRVPFGDRLSGMCAIELAAAHSHPERVGEMIERLLNSLAFTVAMATKGDQKALGEMLEGATSYLYEASSDHAKVAANLAKAGL